MLNNEEERLKALYNYNILDTLPEEIYDSITTIASTICDTPISAISFIDKERQWFKSIKGLNLKETNRNISFCTHAILEDDIFIVNDALNDPRFVNNPLVVNEPNIRFYAGMPLTTHDGYNIGSMCIIDTIPKELNQQQIKALKALAKQVIIHLETINRLENKQANLNILLENTDNLIWSINTEYKLVSFNSIFKKIISSRYNFVPEIGINLKDHFDFDGDDFWETSYKKVLNGEKIVIENKRVTDEENLYYEYTFNPVFLDKEVTGAVIFAQDITKRKINEEELIKAKKIAEKSDKVKTEFLATISHEIRTPINGIIGMTDLLSNTPLNHEQSDFIQVIKNSSDYLMVIVNDILGFSKFETEKIELEKQPFEMSLCIDQVSKLMETKARNKNIDISYYINNNVPNLVIGDLNKLKQIIINLIDNSIKFSNRGKVSLSVELIKEYRNIVKLSFKVTDNGIGIDKETINKLFKPFSQADSSTKKRNDGTGLGLAISKKLVQLMNGDISLKSEVGKGSEFFFTIELEKFTGVMEYHENDTKNSYISNKLSNKRVLIIDTNHITDEKLSTYINSLTMITVTTKSLVKAINLIKKDLFFDIILIDTVSIPEALDLVENVRLIDKKIPIILILPSQPPEDNIITIKNLLATYLIKPIKEDNLYDLMISGIYKNEVIHKEETNLSKEFAKKFPINILLVEDNLINQKLATKILEKMGYKIDISNNGLECLNAVEEHKYDLIFMDVQMPEMDGIEATEVLVSKYKANERPKIIAITANAMEGDRERCINAGMDDYIAKPISIKSLQDIILKWFQ